MRALKSWGEYHLNPPVLDFEVYQPLKFILFACPLYSSVIIVQCRDRAPLNNCHLAERSEIGKPTEVGGGGGGV